MGADTTQIRGIYQSIQTAQVTAARIIMPASTVLTDTIRESIATSVRSCLGVHKSSPLASTEESASTFLGSETGIGLGINDPETSCCTQDARRLLDGIMSPDDRLAAATWGALHHLLDAEGNPNPNTENHFTTWSVFMWRVSGARCWGSRGMASLIESDS